MKKLTILSLILFISLMAACSKEKPVAEPETNEKVDTDPIAVEPEVELNYYPFTGIGTEEDISQRAVAVMVSNQQMARPQTGITKADVVFEMLTEGNITRFMAIYHSMKPEVVGPIRSAREYFFTLADNYGALYIYSGAANFVNDMIFSRDVEHIQGGLYDNDGHLIVRESFRKAPHNMYLQYGAVEEVAKEKGYEMKREHESMPFLKEDEELDLSLGYEEGTYAKIDYFGSKPVVEFEYDEANGKYTRINDGVTTAELESEIPVQVENVFIVEADHRVIDDELRREIDIESGGNATLLHHGQALELSWENQDGRIVPVKDGQVVPFVPGQTWIIFVQTVPGSNTVEQVQIGK